MSQPADKEPTPHQYETAKQFNADALNDINIKDTAPISSLGEGYKEIGMSREPFTVELADSILNCKELPFDRQLDNKWVVELIKAMRGGNFVAQQVQIVVCELNGVKYRLNGQHVSWARSMLDTHDKAFSKSYKPLVTVCHYKAKTEEDLRMLYANIDRAKVRSRGQVVQSYLFGKPEFQFTNPEGNTENYSKRLLSALSTGLVGWIHGFSSSRRPSADELSYMISTTHYEIAMRVAEFLRDCPAAKKHIQRGPIWAAMFATFDRSKSDSEAFWIGVRDGVGLEADDPRLKLSHMLMQYSVNAGLGGSSARAKTASGEEMYRWCIDAWNAYRNKKAVRFAKFDKTKDRVAVQ